MHAHAPNLPISQIFPNDAFISFTLKFVGGLSGAGLLGGEGVAVMLRGTIPQFGILSNPLLSTVDQLLAPVNLDHAAAAPGAP